MVVLIDENHTQVHDSVQFAYRTGSAPHLAQKFVHFDSFSTGCRPNQAEIDLSRPFYVADFTRKGQNIDLIWSLGTLQLVLQRRGKSRIVMISLQDLVDIPQLGQWTSLKYQPTCTIFKLEIMEFAMRFLQM